jgi:mono/diheme cytochrome c family protein
MSSMRRFPASIVFVSLLAAFAWQLGANAGAPKRQLAATESGLGDQGKASTSIAGISGRAGEGKVVSPTVITVTAGKPTELAFRLSRSSPLPWTAKAPLDAITFKVANRGSLPHTFRVCTTPAKDANANTCDGKGTKLLRPGQSTTLTVLFKERGIYEYLCTVPGQAADGMKGLIGVGVKLAKTPAPTPVPETTSTPTTATTTTPAPSSLVGNANAGKVVFSSAGCASCHTLAAAGASGTVGPSLDVIKPTQPVILDFVTNGSNANANPMPAYAGTLTPGQINDLAAYVYLATHTIN